MASRATNAALKSCATMVAGALALVILPLAAQGQADFPHAPVSWPGGRGIAELHISGDTAKLVLVTPAGTIVPLRTIETVSDALAILADERLSFAWPALLAWAGDDLHILRDKTLVSAERAFQDAKPLPLTKRERMEGWSKQYVAFDQYMTALERSGLAANAIAKIKTEIARPTLHDNAYFTVRSQLQIMLANHLFRAGDTAQAIDVLFKASANAQWPGARENININAAALLAIIGKYDWALKIDNGTDHDGREKEAEFYGERLPDSSAYYTAIRACALNGLGRKDEAQAILAKIVPEPQASAHFSVKVQARLWAASCMHDAPALANELAAQIETAPPAADVLLQVQPADATAPKARETLVAALSTDITTRAMAGRVRILGGNLVPALNSWTNGATPALQ